MGDLLRFAPVKGKKKTRRKEGLQWFETGVWRVALLPLPNNRVVLVVTHRFSRMMLSSWPMSSWDYASLEDQLEGELMSRFLKRSEAKKEAADSLHAAADQGLEREHPAIHEYLTVKRFDDGTERQTATLLVFCEGGQFKICLSDRDTSQTLWASGETLTDALEALEASLQSPSPQWRTSAGKRQKGK